MEEESIVSADPSDGGTSTTDNVNLLTGSTPTTEETNRLPSDPSNSNAVTVTDTSSELQQLQITKKKKTRRKPRQKKTSTSATSCTSDSSLLDTLDDSSVANNEIDFKITAVGSQKKAKVIRIKNDECCKHINLNYYANSGGNRTDASGLELLPSTSRINNVTNASAKNKPLQIQSGTALQSPIVSHPHQSNLQSTISNLQNRSAGSAKQNAKHNNKGFPSQLSMKEVSEGLENGQFIRGVIRINAKNYREAYISSNDRSEQDYVIQSVADRNRALEGDVVAIKLKHRTEWTEKQKTAYVVHIIKEVHSRTAIGFLQLMPDRDKQYAHFIPRDFRVPRIKIPTNMCPPSFHLHPNRYESMLFRAKITQWKNIKHPIGTIIDNVGVVGDLESETAALLAEHNLDITPFSPQLVRCVTMPDAIPESEFSYREDLRKQCIFTIDPLTARDLDDAVSCKELENGNLEVGVHISDVTYYLKEGTNLDKLVSQKATTIYLVNSVYHMLPRELCLHCSLLPGQDKLAFSVFWEMTKSGEIVRHRFARTVINSCAQLAYEHAQQLIDNQEGELPEIHGNFTDKDISKIINYLQAIAVNLRAQRFESGALRIDQTKLLFKLDQESGEPAEYFVHENKEANKLIEEFMLLANISVAQKIADDFPDLAFLRCHEAPNPRMLGDLEASLKMFNINVDLSSSKAIQTTLSNVAETNGLGILEMAVLNHLLAKPMTRARYFCAGSVESEEDFQHYALHVPIYTHFTSPIRRYADIMVHRLLAASLGYSDKPVWHTTHVMEIADNCNKQKYSAKLAGEASSDLYLAHYIADHQPFIQPAVVVDVRNSSFDILVVSTVSIIRMFPNSFGNDVQYVKEENTSKRRFLVIFPQTTEFPEECYLIQLFCIVKVGLHRKAKTNKLEAKLLRPISSGSFGSSQN